MSVKITEGLLKGERERSMEDEENESSAFQHYTPQHPLPEEIKNLARDDTVCKYCGVSYLIHNEIKALEDKLVAAEKELFHLRGQKQREEQLNKENALLRDERNDLRSALDAENKLVSSVKAEVEMLKEKNKQSEESVQSYKNKHMAVLRKFSALSQVVRQEKQTLEQLKEVIRKDQPEICGQIKDMRDKVEELGLAAAHENEKLESQVQCLDMEKLVLTNSNTALENSLRASETNLTEAREELVSLKRNIENLEKNMMDADSLGQQVKQLEQSLQEKEKILESLGTASENEKKQLQQCRAELRSRTAELEDSGNKLRQLEKDQEVSLQKMSLEVKAKDAELVTCQKQQKTLENKLREMERKVTESKHTSDLTQSEAQSVKESLERAVADREALKAERELMIEAHQNRIEELRDSFKNKMAEMEGWPQKLQAAIKAERLKYQSEMKTLEENLKHNFVLELQIEKDKYNELLKKFQTQERDKNEMRKTEQARIEEKYKQELEELKHQLMDSKRQAQEREEELQREITSLKKSISSLQDRLAKLDTEDSGQVLQLKTDLASAQQQLAEADTNLVAMETKLKEVQRETQFLQKVVEKECEERFELTEALSDARRELLELKRPPGGYNNTKRQSVVSLGSAQSSAGSHRSTHSTALGSNAQPHPPSDGQQQAKNIILSYSNNNSNKSTKESEAELRDSRKRIANMMGRQS